MYKQESSLQCSLHTLNSIYDFKKLCLIYLASFFRFPSSFNKKIKFESLAGICLFFICYCFFNSLTEFLFALQLFYNGIFLLMGNVFNLFYNTFTLLVDYSVSRNSLENATVMMYIV